MTGFVRRRRPALLAMLGVVVGTVAVAACSPEGTGTGVERSSAPTAGTDRWVPEPGATFVWQLRGSVDTDPVEADVYDLDGFETTAATVEELHRGGAKVVCYVSVGSHEDWRPDADAFPEDVLGAPLDGWEGERWLDVRELDILTPLIAARFDACRDEGFDAVEPDNVDAYLNDSGFPITATDQLAFVRRVIELAHQRGLSVALKNDLGQIPDLVDEVDFAVVEQCHEFGECDQLDPFVQAGKAVFAVEYDECPDEPVPGHSTYLLPLELDGSRRIAC